MKTVAATVAAMKTIRSRYSRIGWSPVWRLFREKENGRSGYKRIQTVLHSTYRDIA
jgi:hypothetical protein